MSLSDLPTLKLVMLTFTAVDYPMQLLPNTHPSPVKRSSGSFRQVQHRDHVCTAILSFACVPLNAHIPNKGVSCLFSMYWVKVQSKFAWIQGCQRK